MISSMDAIPERKVNYAGYQVIRITNKPGDSSSSFQEISTYVYAVAEAHNLDVWAANAVQGWMDVMIPPELVNSTSALFPGITYGIHIADVEQSIVESEVDRLTNGNQDFFSNFRNSGEISDWSRLIADNYPNIARVISVGQTYYGNDILGLELGFDDSNQKPVVVIYCGIHAREWITPATCCWIIDQLTSKDPEGEELIDQFHFVIIPILNVDGYDYTFTNDRLWRKNRQPNPGSSCVGTDLNRNYGFGWSGPGASNNPCSETFYGTAAFSSPETAVIRELLNKFRLLGTLISFWDLHAYSALWMSAWGYTCNSLPNQYPEMLDNMRQSVAACRDVNGNSYDFGSICRTIYQASGSSVDFAYGTAGVIHSYTTEAYGTSFTPPVSYIPLVGSETWAGLKQSVKLIALELSNK